MFLKEKKLFFTIFLTSEYIEKITHYVKTNNFSLHSESKKIENFQNICFVLSKCKF